MLEVQAVWSASVGCLLCLLVYQVVVALRAVASGSPFLMETANFSMMPALLTYHESWDVVTVFLVLVWLKFLSVTSKEYLREAGMAKPQISAQRMLKMTLLFAASIGCTTVLCYAAATRLYLLTLLLSPSNGIKNLVFD